MTSRTRRAAAALVLAAAACRRGPPGARLHLAIGQLTSATTLDPHLHDDERSYSTLDHFYDKLVGFGPEMQIVPRLAVRWENLSDTQWRFHLRRGVVFHDGRPFGAEDVRASILRAQRLPGSMVSYYVQSVRDVKVVDGETVDVITLYPSPVLLNKLVFIGIVPRDTPSTPIARPVGTGPYAFVSGAPGRRIEGRRFPAYWGPASAFEEVSIVPLPEASDRAHAVPDGRVDVVGRFPEEFWSWAATRKNIRLVARQGITEALLGFSMLDGSPVADPAIRRAIALGLDRRSIAQRGLHGLGAPLDQLVPATVFGHSNRLPPLAPDPAAARAALERAGWRSDTPMSLLLPDYLRGVGVEVARQLAEIGVHAELIVLPFSAFNDRWARGDVPLTLFGWGAATGDASDFLDALVHSREGGYGRSNYSGYANPEMDRLIELSDRTLDPATRHDLVTRAQEMLRTDVPFVPLVLRDDLYAIRRGLAWTPRPDRRVRAFDFRLTSAD